MSELSADQILAVEKIVQAEVDRRWEARVASASRALDLAVQVGLDRLKNAEVTLPPQIITKVGEVEHLGSPLMKLVEEHAAKRFSENKNLIESWIDQRWDKKKEGVQRWFSWAGLAGLVVALTAIGKLVQTEVRSEVQSQVPAEMNLVKVQMRNVQAEFDKALEAAKEVRTNAAAVALAKDSVAGAKETADQTLGTFNILMHGIDSRMSSAVETMERLLREHPEFLRAFKEQLELPLGTVIVVRREQLPAFLDRHLAWVSETAFDPTVAKWTIAKNGRSVMGSRYLKEQVAKTENGLLKEMPPLETLPPPIDLPTNASLSPDETEIREALNKLPALVPLIKINP